MGKFGGRLLAAGLFVALGAGPAASGDTYRLLMLEGSLVKWGAPATGTPAQVSYALVDHAQPFPNARNCTAMQPLAQTLERNRIGRKEFLAELRAAFDAWTRAADITFVPAADAGSADILIGAQVRPRGRAFTNVDFDRHGTDGTRSISRALICLNPAMPWKVGFDGNMDVYDLRYTLMHEIGHAIGLDHPGSPHVVMSFKYSEGVRDLQSGDRSGAAALYGHSSLAAAAGGTAQVARPQTPAAGATQAVAPSLSLGVDDQPAPKRP